MLNLLLQLAVQVKYTNRERWHMDVVYTVKPPNVHCLFSFLDGLRLHSDPTIE